MQAVRYAAYKAKRALQSIVSGSNSLLPTHNNAASSSLLSNSKSTSMTRKDFQLMIRHFMSDQTSRRILAFLTINFTFMFVELIYGFMSNSMGLISDAGHMLFDCTALAIGLYASFISKLKANSVHTYGYERYEILSGFVNGVFLLFIGYFVFVESVERLFSPPEIESENLVVVSVLGLLVNLVGLAFFHDFSHGHGDGGCSHGHSHGGSSSSGGVSNHNIFAIYLHILADTLGSVGVIISSLLVQHWGWTSADAICSIIISGLIIGSVVPLIKSSTQMLMQRAPEHKQDEIVKVLHSINALPGVVSYRAPHFWSFSESNICATIHVVCQDGSDSHQILNKVTQCIKSSPVGVNNLCVAVEKEAQQQHSHQPAISNKQGEGA